MTTMTIYTDGSHFKHRNGRLGVGGILVDDKGNIIDQFSQEILPEFLNIHYNTSDVSNPTMEMLAVLIALEKFKPSQPVILKADYQGVKEWMTGKWKINKPYIQKLKDDITEVIRKNNINIKFEWIRGHQKGITPDSKFNNYVDLLAKGDI